MSSIAVGSHAARWESGEMLKIVAGQCSYSGPSIFSMWQLGQRILPGVMHILVGITVVMTRKASRKGYPRNRSTGNMIEFP